MVGWTRSKQLSFCDSHGTPQIYMIYDGHGALHDFDGRLLQASGTSDVHIYVVDLTHELAQNYDHGDYDSGSIAFPDYREAYAKHARRLRQKVDESD